MIFRAIIEEIVDKYTVKVRIPLIHKASSSSQHTPIESLPEAKICTLPNTHPNIQIGDIVIVAFENNDFTRPIIIGYLYKEIIKDTAISTTLNSLAVQFDTKLNEDTSIGNVKPSEIKQLKGVKENIQEQLNQLTNRISLLEDLIKKGDMD